MLQTILNFTTANTTLFVISLMPVIAFQLWLVFYKQDHIPRRKEQRFERISLGNTFLMSALTFAFMTSLYLNNPALWIENTWLGKLL
tara:strand:+ start:583 stop:843 length:261 start_codon:yes stop_codon:yes gene_type:complete